MKIVELFYKDDSAKLGAVLVQHDYDVAVVHTKGALSFRSIKAAHSIDAIQQVLRILQADDAEIRHLTCKRVVA